MKKECMYAYDNDNNLKGIIYKVSENCYLYKHDGLNLYTNSIDALKRWDVFNNLKILPFKLIK